MASSPAAAEATLATRAGPSEAEDPSAADRIGISELMDQVEDDSLDGRDMTPGALPSEESQHPRRNRTLGEFRKQAAKLKDAPDQDAKLALLAKHVKGLINDGYDPIVFCRFIKTADYVAQHLRTALPKIPVGVVTGEHPSEERAVRVADLVEEAGGGHKSWSPPTACPRA